MATTDHTEALKALMESSAPFHVDVIGGHEFQCSLRFSVLMHPVDEVWIFRESRDEIEASSFTLYSAAIKSCHVNKNSESRGGHLVDSWLDATIIITLHSGTTVAISKMKIPS